jgi:biopolymer transport protein ExbD
MSTWQVRKEGSPEVYTLPSEEDVFTALRDGNFVPTDEVKGSSEELWRLIEVHPTFAEAAEEVEPPRGEAADETHLDMNPLIDVCLVLLIFFILTITYASMERAVDVPEDSPDEKGAKSIEYKDIKDKVFKVFVKMEGEKPIIKIEGKEVPLDRVYAEMETIINTTGRKEMLLDIENGVPWGTETAIIDAAKGNKVHNIINNQRPGVSR